ncbi:DUF6711 family protein [Symbiobacterium thermophilum]|uniref:Uncharacterized protein n=1 Tax=Symbiobacterium thermophilum TaxID=2734 RepID=A0A953IF59_SYMTR|nr:DUF6711 family protein [Symbiobacterium thermophilum]MBY6278229.1 hypothetical protein [Symbiobacterium thermophilum]
MALVTINGQAVTPNPSDCKVGHFWLTKAGRAASGLMLMERIAKKRTVTLSWDAIREDRLRAILDLLDSRTFHTVTYPDPQGDNGQATITAYVGDIQMDRYHTRNGYRWWIDVEIPLIER